MLWTWCFATEEANYVGQTDQEKEKLAKTENSQKNSQWKVSQEAFPSSEISSKWAFNEFAKQQEE